MRRSLSKRLPLLLLESLKYVFSIHVGQKKRSPKWPRMETLIEEVGLALDLVPDHQVGRGQGPDPDPVVLLPAQGRGQGMYILSSLPTTRERRVG